MMSYHKDIASYIDVMSSLAGWYRYDMAPKNFIRAGLWKLYCESKWILHWILLVSTCIGLKSANMYGVADGTFLYAPMGVMSIVMNTHMRFSSKRQEELIEALNQHFLDNSEPWMNELRSRHMSFWHKCMRYMGLYLRACIPYMIVAFITDTVLHYGFDSIERPFILAGPLTSFLRDTTEWNLRYYTILFFNNWSLLEGVRTLEMTIYNYSILTAGFLVECIIFKTNVKDLKLNMDSETDAKLGKILSWHCDIIRLNNLLKDYFGFRCAFTLLITSFLLTLSLYTTYSFNENGTGYAYCVGTCVYFACAFIFCYLGQQITNQGEDLFEELYDLPWYRFSAADRKSLIMLIRQACVPLTIDYHGNVKMNLVSFQDTMTSTYTYFTLLKTLVA